MKSDNKMNATLSLGNQPSRRDFLKISGVMGGGLVLAATAPGWAQGTSNLVGKGAKRLCADQTRRQHSHIQWCT